MTTTTAKCTRPGQTSKFIPNAFNFKGYLVSKSQKGVGKATEKGGMNSYGEGETWEEYDKYEDFFKPYFNNEIVVKDFDKQAFKNKYAELDVRKIIGTEAEKTLIKWGTNVGGLLIEDVEAIKEKTQAQEEKKIANKEIPIEIGDGHFGLYLRQRVPLSVFDLIKSFGKYWSASEIDDWNEDMDDFSRVGEGKYMKGWYFQKNIIKELQSCGYQVVLK